MGEVHKEDGAQMNTHDNSSVDHTKELANTMSMLINSGGAMTAWDEVSIAELDPQGVQEARKLEIPIFLNMGAYIRWSEDCVRREGGTIIDVKWIGVNKGDQNNPQDRSRLVGREFNDLKDLALRINATIGSDEPCLQLCSSHGDTCRRGRTTASDGERHQSRILVCGGQKAREAACVSVWYRGRCTRLATYPHNTSREHRLW